MKKLNKDNAYLVFAFFILVLFAYITYLSPLAGDDWGYALGGRNGNPFVLAYNQYFNWSGRYFSEFWDYLVAPNKILWNILNPIIFASIFIVVYKIINPKRNRILINFILLFLILFVKDQVRMETYSWLVGTTFTIPLLFSLIYIYLAKRIIIGGDRKRMYYIIMALLSFYIGLAMENIAVTMVVMNILILIYAYVYKTPRHKWFLIPTITSVLSLVLLRLSPGATYRLANNHGEWLGFSIFEQIQINWINFMRYTFIDNKYLIFVLSLVVILFVLKRQKQYKNNRIITIMVCSVSGLVTLFSMAEMLFSITNLSMLRLCFDIYSDVNALILTSIVYMSFVAVIIVLLYVTLIGDEFYEGFFYLAIAGVSNLAMLLSPIFGSRSSLYTIYFIILLVCYLLSITKIEKRGSFPIVILAIVLIFGKTREYIFKYQLVAEVQRTRERIIQWYQENPEEKEYWLPAMPIYTIHSGNFDEDNEVHRIYFLRYYGLDETKMVKFYYESGE